MADECRDKTSRFNGSRADFSEEDAGKTKEIKGQWSCVQQGSRGIADETALNLAGVPPLRTVPDQVKVLWAAVVSVHRRNHLVASARGAAHTFIAKRPARPTGAGSVRPKSIMTIDTAILKARAISRQRRMIPSHLPPNRLPPPSTQPRAAHAPSDRRRRGAATGRELVRRWHAACGGTRPPARLQPVTGAGGGGEVRGSARH